jgi:undecaprenyl-diphosphatase
MATLGLRRQVGPDGLRARPTTAIVGSMADQSESRRRRSTLLPVSSGAGLAAALILLIAVSSVFAAVWDRWAGDVDGVRSFQGLLNGATKPLIDAVTALGDRVLRFALVLVATGWLVYIRRPRLAGMMVAVLLATSALVQVLKWTVDRPRPELPPDLDVLAISTSGSFPSGHVAFVALFFGVLAYLAYRDWHAAPWRRGVMVVVLLVPVVLIGPARMAWGVHWPSDVLGGYLVALLGLQALILLRRRFGPDYPDADQGGGQGDPSTSSG